DEKPERRPVPADDPEVTLGPAGHGIPGIQAGRLGTRHSLVLVGDAPARRAVPQSRADVDDRAVAVDPPQPRVPHRPVAVHVLEQPLVLVALEAVLDLAAVLFG